MSPDRISGNIFKIRDDEKIPATIGDGNEILLSGIEVRVEFTDAGDILQTWEGDKFYVDSGIFPESE